MRYFKKEYEWKMQYSVVMRIPVNPLHMHIRHNQTPWIWLWMDGEKILSFLTAWKPINEKNCFLKNVMSLSWFINISDKKWLELRPSLISFTIYVKTLSRNIYSICIKRSFIWIHLYLAFMYQVNYNFFD